MRRVGALVGAVALVAATGCARAQARVVTPAPPPPVDLALPEPPPRLLIPVSVEPPEPPPEKPAEVPTRPAATRPPVTAPPPTPPTVEPPPPPVLQAGANLAQFESRANADLTRAERDLARVSPMTLARDAREQYDSAQRFIRMARDALAARNVVYAAYCADKAATLASLLVKSTDTSF